MRITPKQLGNFGDDPSVVDQIVAQSMQRARDAQRAGSPVADTAAAQTVNAVSIAPAGASSLVPSQAQPQAQTQAQSDPSQWISGVPNVYVFGAAIAAAALALFVVTRK